MPDLPPAGGSEGQATGAAGSKGVTQFASLRAEIRSITDAAAKPLLTAEIYAQVTRRNVRMDYFYVAIAQMCDDLQLERVPVQGRGKSKFAYKSGSTPVDSKREYRPERDGRLKGFRELAREADAKKRGRAA